ncbi:unnamed protein product [Moneuplotes crassus]|uniref:Uncharacterized protein n=1 Tax=Euplotes crassus TaxID=5936 RepID=A0AAD2CXF8_EUPCR|nr:unnamed protein product [Moneuplotes crassus]
MEDKSDNDTQEQSKRIFDSSDRMANMMRKVDEIKREKDIERAETLDFQEDPQYIKNAKKDIQDYVDKTGSIGDKINHFFNIFRQFSNSYNQANQLYNPDLTNILKTKRIQYVTTLPRFTLNDDLAERMTLAEKAESSLVNELKLWGHKYAILSFTLGINLSALLYSTIFRYHGRAIRLIFSATLGWSFSTYLLNKALDKIYYPIMPIFQKYRAMEKKYDPDTFKKIISFEKDVEETDSIKRFKKGKDKIEALNKLSSIDEEIMQETQKAKDEFEELMNESHTRFINENDFGGDVEKYEEFINSYIHCYYEPLVPEYEEGKFFVDKMDGKLDSRLKWLGIKNKKVTGIFMK